MSIQSIVNKIQEYFNSESCLQEAELKKIFSKRFEDSYKYFRTFCREQEIDLPEPSLWNFYCSQNISLHTQLLKTCILIDSATACKIVCDSLADARENIMQDETVSLKLSRVK